MFESQEQIDEFIDALGVFTDAKGVLYVKTSKTDCQKVDDIYINGVSFKAKGKLIDYLLNNSHPFLDLYILFREIDLSVFKKYDDRNNTIEQITEERKKIKDAPNHIKKHFRLIKFSRIIPKYSNYWIWDIKENSLSEYNETLLSDSDKKKAITYQNKAIFQKIVDDDLENQYAEAYKENLADFKALKINENYGS